MRQAGRGQWREAGGREGNLEKAPGPRGRLMGTQEGCKASGVLPLPLGWKLGGETLRGVGGRGNGLDRGGVSGQQHLGESGPEAQAVHPSELCYSEM